MTKALLVLGLVFGLLDLGVASLVMHAVSTQSAVPLVHSVSTSPTSSFFNIIAGWKQSAANLTQITSSLP